jgi:hypothetical protein
VDGRPLNFIRHQSEPFTDNPALKLEGKQAVVARSQHAGSYGRPCLQWPGLVEPPWSRRLLESSALLGDRWIHIVEEDVQKRLWPA